MNGDGLKDLIFGELAGGVVYAFRKENGELDSLKTLEANNAPIVMNDGLACEVADLNGDDLFDLIISPGNREYASMRIYYNSGTVEKFKFTDYVEPLFNGNIFESKYNTVESNDMDMDGDLDLMFSATNEEGNTFQVYYSENIGTITNAEFSDLKEVNVTIDGKFNTEGYQGNRKNGLALGDLNGDGKPELALGGGSYGKCFQVYWNESKTDIQNEVKFSKWNKISAEKYFTLNGKRINTSIINYTFSSGVYLNNKNRKVFVISKDDQFKGDKYE